MSENTNELEGNEKNFAKTCLEMNTLEELSEPHAPEDADVDDMKHWDISAQEWSDAIEAARLDMIADEEDE